MKNSMGTDEKRVLVELVRRARAVGQVRRQGLTLPWVAQLYGIERRRLEVAMDATEKVTAATLGYLVTCWQCTWADLLGDQLARTVLAPIGAAKFRTPDAWARATADLCRRHIESRRVAPMPGRSRLYYAETEQWNELSVTLAAIMCVTPCVLEVIGEAWNAPRK